VIKTFRSLTRSPILWGILGSIVFFTLVHTGPLGTPFIKRYFTGHPVEYAETVLFAVGMAALVLKVIATVAQYPGLRHSPLGPVQATSQGLEEQCQTLLERLAGLPWRRQEEYYVRRLRAAIDYVRRSDSADGLDDELKYFADLDATRAHNSFALFRVIVWSIPILGFLGTVIGITMALNGIDTNALDESMMQVLKGLGLKFDTTALALGLAMLLMFMHSSAEQTENRLLEEVDRCVARDMDGRFPHITGGGDGNVLAVRRMAEAVIQAADRLVQRQAELWQVSMEAAAARWARMGDAAAEVLNKAMVEGLADGLKAHAQQLSAAEQAAAEANRRHWDKLTDSQTQNAQALAALQAGMNRQAEVLGRAIEASGELARLEDALNRNLASLAGAKHFDQAVHGLAAAVHLLNARLSDTPVQSPGIQLESARRTAKAA
jgi:biopolymer transport protein ExbB/TolQ